jgi:hypothetical protein
MKRGHAPTPAARVLGITVVVLLAMLFLPGSANAGAGGSDRPVKVWATNGLHTIGPADPARCPAQDGKVLLFATYVGGTGHATHVGTYSFAGDHCTYWDFAGSRITYGFGNWALTAANGDVFFAPYGESTTPPPTDPTVDIVTVAAHEITGGTGRFEDASGWMDCTLKLVITDPATFTADMWGSCEGQISY